MPENNISISTYKKLILLLIILTGLFTIMYIFLYHYIEKQESEVHENAIANLNKEVNSLFKLKSEPLLSTITDLTYWDKFTNYFETLDHEWFEEDVASLVQSFDVDYAGAYSLEARFLSSLHTDKIKSENFIPPYAFKLLHEKRFLKFYMRIPEGIVEVMGATVHPSNESEKDRTQPTGYFFISRLLDIEYIKSLEQISGASVFFLEDSVEKERLINKKETLAIIPLLNWNDEQISQLVFSRPLNLNFDTPKQIFHIVLIAFFINLFLTIYFYRKWVYKPLHLVTKILRSKDTKAITTLKKVSGEFGHIGNLFEENNIKNEELLIAKDKAEEGDKLKTAFLTNLSHEIRTPMNAILGFSGLLKNASLTSKERIEYIDIIGNSGTNLVLIIDDLIEMSKIDSNQIEPNYALINLKDSLNDIYESVKITIPKNKLINFQLEMPAIPYEEKVLVDITKLKQIITNLLTNAIKFTDQGFIKFGYAFDASKNILVFTVEDSGQGIQDKNQQLIFNRFRKLEVKSSDLTSGLGLGLSICKAYVEMMGGEISLHSELNKGSKFTFTLPLRVNSLDEEFTGTPLINQNIDPNKLSGSLLVVEDDNINYLLVQKLLESKKLTLLRAENGIEAVEKCLNNREIDMVLMDLKMPLMDGFEARKRIKLVNPDLPVIAHTAFVSDEIKAKIEKAGFYGYIKKPLQKELLFNIINDIITKKPCDLSE